jgi:hypothetical protein
MEFDLVASLHALPETDPIDVEGMQFHSNTCESYCAAVTGDAFQTICPEVTCY